MAGIEFWYEFGSTYSYPTAVRIERMAADAGIALHWRPFLLSPIFQALGWNDSPFNIYPAKGRYMWRDLERVCAADGLPLKLPPARFPQNGLKAARLALVGDAEGWTPALTRAVFAANYAEQKDISDDATLTMILRATRRRCGACLCRRQRAREQAGAEGSDRGGRGAGTFRRAVLHRRR